jgi:prophage regulatory protein
MNAPLPAAVPIKAVPANHLHLYGITYSRVHIDRLVKAGKFPKPFKLSANRNAWWEADIVAFLQERAAPSGGDEVRLAVARRAAAASVAARTAR